MASTTRLALRATLHCLTGCAIGEVLGMVLGGAMRWTPAATIALSVILAFLFGYFLTLRPLLAAGIPPRRAMGLAIASDTASIGIMEIVDNLVMLVIPGAMSAGPATALFWISLALAVLAGIQYIAKARREVRR